MGGGKMSPMMIYLMGGKSPKYDNGGKTTEGVSINDIHPTVLRHLNKDLFNQTYPSGTMHTPFKGEKGDDEWNNQVELYKTYMSQKIK